MTRHSSGENTQKPPSTFAAYDLGTSYNFGAAAAADAGDDDDSAISHSFTVTTFTSPTFCCVCKAFISGVYKQGVACTLCGAAAHTKCQDAAISSVPCTPGRKRESGMSQLSNAVKSLRRTGSSEPQISGPTNFQHVGGATTGRTFVPIEQAQKDDRFKKDPVPVSGKNQLAAPGDSGDHSVPPPAPGRAAPPRRAPPTAGGAGAPQRVPPSRPQRPSTPGAADSSTRPPAPGRPHQPGGSHAISSPHHYDNVSSLAKDVGSLDISSPRGGGQDVLPAEWQPGKALSNLSFGSSIVSQPRIQLRGYKDQIPSILVFMGRELREKRGFIEEGLFRIAPSRTEQTRVRNLLSESPGEEQIRKALHDCKDPHVLAALMKEWCRMLDKSILSELARPDLELLTQESFDEALPSSQALENYHSFLFGNAYISSAPRATLLWLLDLMAVVVEHKAENKMGTRAVTTCFAPSIYVLEDPLNSPIDSITVIKLITTLLNNALTFVQEHGRHFPRDTFGDQNPRFTNP